MKSLFRFSALLTGLALFAACGDDGPTGSNTGDELTQAETEELAADLFEVLGEVFTLGFGASEQPVLNLPNGISFSASSPAETINETFSSSDSCDGGGTISVSGSVTGDVDDTTGEGNAELELTMNFTNCLVTGQTRQYTVSGDPNITMAGDFEFTQTSFSFTFQVRGGFSFTTDDGRSGTCAVSIDVSGSFDQSTGSSSESVNGSMCGRNINEL